MWVDTTSHKIPEPDRKKAIGGRFEPRLDHLFWCFQILPGILDLPKMSGFETVISLIKKSDRKGIPYPGPYRNIGR